MKKFLKWFATFFCVAGLVVYTSLPFTNSPLSSAEFLMVIVLDALMILFLYLLHRKKKTTKTITSTPKSNSYSTLENKQDLKKAVSTECVVDQCNLFKIVTTVVPDSEQKNELEQIRDLKANSFPSNQGLYPHEIVMLSYAARFKTSNNIFQGFWQYAYAVDNPQELLSSLESKGFICKGSASEALKLYKVPELKTILERHGLKKSGTKAVLMERLLNELKKDDLEQLTTVRPYHLTEKGSHELSDNEYITYLTDKTSHRSSDYSSYGITIWSLNKALHETPTANYRDLIWAQLNNSIPDAIDQINKFQNFGPYAGLRITMFGFLLEERKYSAAYDCYLEALYYEISFSAVSLYLVSVEYLDDGDPTTLYEEAVIKLGNLSTLNQIKNYYELSYTAFSDYLLNKFQKYIASDVFAPIQVAKFIVAEMASDTNTSKQICSDVECQLSQFSTSTIHLR